MWVLCAVAATAIWAGSGLPGLFLSRRTAHGERSAVVLAIIGSLLGLTAASAVLALPVQPSVQIRGILPGTHFHLRLDALAGFFLVPVFLIGAMGAIYGLGYWPQAKHPRTGAKLRLCYGLLVASMGWVVLAADGVLFLFAWEMMALAAFFLVTTEDQKKDVREAGWLYLLATHAGILVLFALFALLRVACGSFELRPIEAGQAGSALRTGIMLTAATGFGFKAGAMPLHFWLPAAHANAPTHVSAILSGVVLKMGIYGILRTLMLLAAPHAAWGGLALLAGTVSAVLGVLFALGQHDLKRLLAYHSIENIGIILMGLGLAVIGQARGKPQWVVLGMAGCLLHVWNHSLFKSLLFFSTGSVIRAAHTREIDRMGGLVKRMPATAALFLVGAIAICGLPPLNGFVSELFIYLALLGTLSASSAVALAAPLLAMAGALALACFVKAYGAVFLGTARTRRAEASRDAPLSMVLPMMVMALACAVIGVFPSFFVRPLDNVIGQWSHIPVKGVSVAALAPLPMLTRLTILMVTILLPAWLWVWRSSRRLRTSLTWDCGYARPGSRMQYTASSFAQGLVGLFRAVLRPQMHAPQVVEPFPTLSGFRSHVDDIVLDRFLRPGWQRVRFEIGRLRFLQQGSVQRYLFYIMLAVFVLLLSAVPLLDAIRRLFTE